MKKPFLSGNERGLLASGFVVASVLALAAISLAFSAHDYSFLAAASGCYLLLGAAYIFLLAGKSRSILLKWAMILASFAAIGLLFFFSWTAFNFVTTFTF